jgi:hypothetical protein
VKGLVGVIAGACAAVLIACSAARAPMSARSTTPHDASGAMPPDAHAQIEELERKIADSRATLKLPETASPMAPTAVHTMSAHTDDPSCHPGANDTCGDVCKLSDSICENATKICDIAKQLPDDAWAAGKCGSAQTTCDESTKKCCGCQ